MNGQAGNSSVLDANWLRQLCIESGADDAGFVQIYRAAVADQKDGILKIFPQTRTLISLVGRLHRENCRTPAGSIAYIENQIVVRNMDIASHKITIALENIGVKSLIGGASAFPIDSDQHPERGWLVSHKPVAVAAGMGHMGLHRSVIHPKFGSFVVLGTILVASEVTEYDEPLQTNPCVNCQLCVDVCPVGAISANGHFNFSACLTYNYRELMGGFVDWVANLTNSKNFKAYRRKVADTETVAMWQSLAFSANFKNACCCAVCPAGENVIGDYIKDRNAFIKENVTPLKEKREVVYVISGSDAEQHVAGRFPHKQVKVVDWTLTPRTIKGFIEGLPLVFQPQAAKDITKTFHFTFTGEDPAWATVIIENQTLTVQNGLRGNADVRIWADGKAWLEFLAKNTNVVSMMLTGKLRIKGNLGAMLDFMKCFPV